MILWKLWLPCPRVYVSRTASLKDNSTLSNVKITLHIISFHDSYSIILSIFAQTKYGSNLADIDNLR